MSIFYNKVYTTLGRWLGKNSFIGKFGRAELTDWLTNEYPGSFQLNVPPKDLIPLPYRLAPNTLLPRLQRRKRTYRCDQRILLTKHPRRIKKSPEPIEATESNPLLPDQNKFQLNINPPTPNNTGENNSTNIKLLQLLLFGLLLSTHMMKESECATGTKAKSKAGKTDNKQNTGEKPATTNKHTSIVKYSKLWHHLFLRILTGLGPFFWRILPASGPQHQNSLAAWAAANTYCSARALDPNNMNSMWAIIIFD